MKKIMLAAAGVTALALSTAGMAAANLSTAADNPASTAGVYVGGGLGYGKTDAKNPAPGMPGLDFSENGVTWLGYAGYQFNQYVGLEGGYIQLPRVKAKVFNVTAFKETLDAIYAAVKLMYPATQSFDVFIKGGVARLNGKLTVPALGLTGNGHKTVFLAGLGADYWVTSNVAITAQGLTTFKHDGAPATYIGTVGVTYKFAV